jgi:hypothetical protein
MWKLHFVGPPLELPPESQVLIKPSGKLVTYLCLIVIESYVLIFTLFSACRTWIDCSFTGTGHYRQVNMVLGNLVHLHWPGLVTLPSGKSVPATTWEHCRYGVFRTFGNTHAVVWDALWV